MAAPSSKEYLTNHQKRLSRYAESKKRTRSLAKFIFENHPQYRHIADKLSSCGNYLTFRHYHDQEKIRLVRANSCDKHLLCGICAARRSARQYYFYRKRWHHVKQNNPDKRIVFFTLTVKNGDDLAERYQHLYASMAALLQKRRNAKKGQTTTAMSRMSGAVWSYEVTNRGRGWHPHIHGIGLIGKGENLKELERRIKGEWEEITGDSHQIKIEFPRSSDNENKAFFEVFKYSLKFADLSFKHQIEVFETLAGRRLMASFGDFYGVHTDVAEESEEIESDFYDIMYKYDKKSGTYRKHFVEDRATSIDSTLPIAHLREKDLQQMNDCDRGIRWQKQMLDYCARNGLKYPKLRRPFSITHYPNNTKESVNTVIVRKVSGPMTSGYQLPLIIAADRSAAT